jgi:hypothetical protein
MGAARVALRVTKNGSGLPMPKGGAARNPACQLRREVRERQFGVVFEQGNQQRIRQPGRRVGFHPGAQ